MGSIERLATCSVLLGLAPAAAVADGKGESKFKIDEASLTLGSDRSKVEAEIKWDSDGGSMFDGWLLGLKLKTPATEVEASTRSRLDEFTSDWRIGLVVGKQWSDPSEGVCWKVLLRGDIEVGRQTYKYFPNAGSTSQETAETSAAATVNIMYWQRTSSEFTPQLKVRYAGDWEAAKPVGIVTPGDADTPATVRSQKVISPPSITPTVLVRGSLFYQPGGSRFAIGPSVAYLWSGESGTDRWDLGGGKQILRAEVWVYQLPGSVTPANARFGVTPFLDWYTEGTAPDGGDREFGFLFQARWGAPIWVY